MFRRIFKAIFKLRKKSLCLFAMLIFSIIAKSVIADYCQENNKISKQQLAIDCQEMQNSSSIAENKTWLFLLKAYEDHDAKSREILEKYSKEKKKSMIKVLSKKLIEDWNLPPDSSILLNPYVLKRGIICLKKDQIVKTPWIHIEVEVNEIGIITNSKIITPKELIPEFNINYFLASTIFRPAFINGKFKSARTIISAHIQIK
jgi:hypothetical protein